MIDALIEGERDPEVLAGMALTRMRPKIPDLRRALVGRFNDHHAVLLRMHLRHADQLDAAIAELDRHVDAVITPFADAVGLLTTIPGVGQRTAEVVIAEIGVDMGRFPTAGHLASWAGMCPGSYESAGKNRSGKARRGNNAFASPCAKRPGPGCAPRTPTLSPVPPVPSPLRQAAAKPKRSSPSPTPCSSSAGTSSPTRRPTTSSATTGSTAATTPPPEPAASSPKLQRLGHTVTLHPAA